MLQAVKSGKHEEVQEAVRDVGKERDSLKAEVSSFTKKVRWTPSCSRWQGRGRPLTSS